MQPQQERPIVKIAPNNPVFDLPVIVGIEEGVFAAAGLDVSFSASYADRERDNAQTPFMARLKENLFDCGSADSYMIAVRPTATPQAIPECAGVVEHTCGGFDDNATVVGELADIDEHAEEDGWLVVVADQDGSVILVEKCARGGRTAALRLQRALLR